MHRGGEAEELSAVMLFPKSMHNPSIDEHDEEEGNEDGEDVAEPELVRRLVGLRLAQG